MSNLSPTMLAAASESRMRDDDRTKVGLCLPAHMMYLMIEAAVGKGLVVRADVLHKLANASAVPLAKESMVNVSRLAKRVDDAARVLLRDLSPDNPIEGLYCCAMFVLTLVDEGYLLDRQNMAVLVALLLLADVRDQEKDAEGTRPISSLNEARWQAAGKKLLNRALIVGYYARNLN